MAKRIVTRVGDVFCVEIDGKYKYFFQYIAKDMTLMNSSVIRAFKTRYPIDYTPDIEAIVHDDVSFYAHTVLRAGIHFETWYKVGKSKFIGNNEIQDVVFGYTCECDTTSLVNFRKVNPLENWRIWNINEDFNFVGILPEKYIGNIEQGGVHPYIEIVSRIKFGYYKYTSPDFEMIKRVPLPDVDSYVKRDMDGVVTYYHFKGKHAVRQLVISGDRVTRLTEDTPEANGMTLRKADFGDTNWLHREFITADEFEKAWQEKR